MQASSLHARQRAFMPATAQAKPLDQSTRRSIQHRCSTYGAAMPAWPAPAHLEEGGPGPVSSPAGAASCAGSVIGVHSTGEYMGSANHNPYSSSAVSSTGTSHAGLHGQGIALRQQVQRRAALASAVAAAATGAVAGPLQALVLAPPAQASKLPAAADRAWEALGGGPADLYFPSSWLGVWDVTSTLISIEVPLGEEALPQESARVLQRAREEDLGVSMTYQVAFIPPPGGAGSTCIYDRRFNTSALMTAYYGEGADFAGRIAWNSSDPNVLRLSLPGGRSVLTRVTRRSSNEDRARSRLETSEFIEQIYETGTDTPRVKASQCFTKFLWRSEEAARSAAGPAIVATQVVSDYLTPYDGEQAFLTAMNRPVALYTYRLAFTRHASAVEGAGHSSALLAHS